MSAHIDTGKIYSREFKRIRHIYNNNFNKGKTFNCFTGIVLPEPTFSNSLLFFTGSMYMLQSRAAVQIIILYLLTVNNVKLARVDDAY